ncbi:MAG: hypothetical protein IKX62_06260 [Bacteroidales bacterium]|nr:hypothetical protein [Bacteroidales bacterium]
MMKETTVNFITGTISIILGVIITFMIQGMIDRSQDKKEVRSALQLVRTELQANIDDINLMCDYLEQECTSANYFLKHRSDLDRCPEDSVNYHSGIIFAEASISVSQDALELLKNSTLFPKIGNNGLSMKIIRAYDSCSTIVDALNKQHSTLTDQFENSVNEQTAGKFAKSGSIDMRQYVKTDYGLYVLRRLANRTGLDSIADISEIQDAVGAIDAFLGKRHAVKP